MSTSTRDSFIAPRAAAIRPAFVARVNAKQGTNAARHGFGFASPVQNFGKQVPMKRPGQPAELQTAYVMLADPLSSYVSGATIAVTGGKPFL